MTRSFTLIQKAKFKKADEVDDNQGNQNVDDDDKKADDDQGGQAKGNKEKPSDQEAQLLKEVMKRKEELKEANTKLSQVQEELKRFDGIDPEAVRTLLKEKQDRETAELEKRGEFDRVKAQMVEQHQVELESVRKSTSDRLEELSAQLASATSHITELTIGRSFGDSAFVRDTLTLTPAKARVVYGSHFEIKDGSVVAYDKPAGATDRTVLVDGSGNPLSFDKAIESIVKADPDHEHLIRSKMKTGSGSNSDPAAKVTTKVQSGRERIAAAVTGGALKLSS